MLSVISTCSLSIDDVGQIVYYLVGLCIKELEPIQSENILSLGRYAYGPVDGATKADNAETAVNSVSGNRTTAEPEKAPVGRDRSLGRDQFGVRKQSPYKPF